VLDGIPVAKKSTRFRLRKKKSGGGSWGGTIAGWGIDMNQSTSQSTNKAVDVTDLSGFVNITLNTNIFSGIIFFFILAYWNNFSTLIQ